MPEGSLNLHPNYWHHQRFSFIIIHPFLIHEADPQSRSVVVCSSFQNLTKQNNFQARIVISIGGTVSVAVWIIDGTHVLSFLFYLAGPLSSIMPLYSWRSFLIPGRLLGLHDVLTSWNFLHGIFCNVVSCEIYIVHRSTTNSKVLSITILMEVLWS